MDVPAELKELDATLSSIESVVDLPALRAEATGLEQQAKDRGVVSPSPRPQMAHPSPSR